MYDRLRAWLDRWGPILPLLVAEFIVWLGFGSLLPVLPIYFHEQGLDLATLGLVIAAWPAARLVSEPIFGWLADRTARVPLMVIGLVATGVFGALPLVWTGPVAFLLLRAGAGFGVGDVRPRGARLPDRCHAARASWRGVRPVRRRPDGRAADRPVDRRIRRGAVRRHRLRVRVQRRRRDRRSGRRSRSVSARRVQPTRPAHRPRPTGPTLPPDSPYVEGRAAAALAADATSTADRSPSDGRAMRLLNRGLIAAIILNAGGYYGGGTYEVIWSLFLQGLGADLALIGLTFAMFGLPVLVLSPFAGRLVDRQGSFAFIVLGMVLPAVTGILYTFMRDPSFAVPLILIEATGFAFLNPALYAVVAASSPPGRSSTAQGLFGAAGTLGFIVASVTAGMLAEREHPVPVLRVQCGDDGVAAPRGRRGRAGAPRTGRPAVPGTGHRGLRRADGPGRVLLGVACSK